MDDLHDALGRRLAVSSLAPCPVEFTAALVNLCSTQSCGKCTPCRVGLSALSDLLADVLEGRADESTLNLIERTARTIYLSSDCAIGYEAGAMALTAIRGFRDDFEHHIREHSCGFDREARVPCVSGCPAHVDIPGYISLVEAGRYADAVKVIRKNNPLPLVCGLVCEHPCEMHCRRGMVDDPMNILALKRFAVEHSDLNDHKPHVVDNTGKRVAVIGGGPAGLSCAYYLAVMGHKVTIFEQRRRLGGMLRYGIPSYRLPRERLQAEIDWILSAGIDVELDHSVNGEELARLRDANGQPIYTPSVAAGNPASLYGYPLNEVANGAWDTTKAMLLAADWTKFVVGVRQDITYKVFDQGVISDTAGNVVYNLMQQDAQAMRVVMRVGFAVANPLTRIAAKGSQYPAGFLTPAASRKAGK